MARTRASKLYCQYSISTISGSASATGSAASGATGAAQAVKPSRATIRHPNIHK